MTLNCFKDAESVGYYLLELIGSISAVVSEKWGKFTMAIPGGKGGDLLLGALLSGTVRPIHWDKIHLFWTDERWVPCSDEHSNYGNALRKGLSELPLNLYPIPVGIDPDTDALNYIRTVKDVLQSKDRLDLAIVGMGADGHVASVFEGYEPSVQEEKIFFRSTHPETGQVRLGFTVDFLAKSEKVVLLVTGKQKYDKLQQVLQTKALAIPAARLLKLSSNPIIITDFDV